MKHLILSVETTKRSENLDIYMSQANRYKALTDEEMAELSLKAINGNKRAADKIVRHNLLFVISVAKRYQGMGLSLDDLIQEGNIGLCIAAQKYDARLGNKFSSFAVEFVRKYITAAITEKGRVVRLPHHKRNEVYGAVSFDAPIGSDEDGEKTLLDTFASSSTADTFSAQADAQKKLDYLLGQLDNKKREIVVKLFGIGCREHTQLELSIVYGVTEERVRQIKLEALERMKSFA